MKMHQIFLLSVLLAISGITAHAKVGGEIDALFAKYGRERVCNQSGSTVTFATDHFLLDVFRNEHGIIVTQAYHFNSVEDFDKYWDRCARGRFSHAYRH